MHRRSRLCGQEGGISTLLRLHLRAAKLRSASVDEAVGGVEEVARIVTQIRGCWPSAPTVIRADSGFCRDDLMARCEANVVG